MQPRWPRLFSDHRALPHPTLSVTKSALLRGAYHFQAYEGLQTAQKLREEYLLVPAKVKEVYLAHLLEGLEGKDVRSAIIFCSTCKVRQGLNAGTSAIQASADVT